MNKPRVILITYGNRFHASSRVRVLNHFERLEEEFETTWLPRIGLEVRDSKVDKIRFAAVKHLYCLKRYFYLLFSRYDIVFVQIMFLPEILLKIIKIKGAVLCYDFDDAVYTYSPTAFKKMVDYADKIVVSTPFLVENIPVDKPYKIIFSPVDTDTISPAEKREGVFTIGWIGAHDGLYHFNSLKNVFLRLKKIIPFKLLVMGAPIDIEGIETEQMVWSEKNEIEALKKIDVGIMPLAPHTWSPKKGGFKLFLYMAAGVPVVATPTGINQIIVKEGENGFLPKSESEWCNAFVDLYNNPAIRKKYGYNGRKLAEALYSYDVCTPQLLQYLLTSG